MQLSLVQYPHILKVCYHEWGTHILVLDDNEDIVNIVTLSLEQQGYEVVGVSNGREGLAAVQEANKQGKPFALYLSDWDMHPMDGIAFCEALKQYGLNGYTPISFL